MKKTIILLLVSFVSFGQSKVTSFLNADNQEIYAFGTNTSSDGYISVGYSIGKFGLYGGVPYGESQIFNKNVGALTNKARFGAFKILQENKWISGVGVQPTKDGTKLNSFVGYNPLKSTDMKLWLIGNVTGSTFSFGAGFSYKLK